MPIRPEKRTTGRTRTKSALNKYKGSANLFGGAKQGVGKWGITIHGQASLSRKFLKIKKTMSLKLYDAVAKSVILVEAEAKYLIVHGYYRPAVDTGRLLNSVTGEVTKNSLTSVEGKIGTSVYYSVYVHEGTWFMKER